MKSNYRWGIILTAFLCTGCTVEKEPFDSHTFRVGISNPEPWGIATKSILQAPDIEDRITSIQYGIYVGGKLYGTASGEDTDEGKAVFPYAGVVARRNFNVYAIANMPVFTFPEDENALEGCTYTVPHYLHYGDNPEDDMSLEALGIPMAGLITVPASTPHDGLFEVPVKRLLAKVRVEIEADIPDAVIGTAGIKNLNRVLYPFGESRPGSNPENLLPFADSESPALSNRGTFTFYVPENMSGSLTGGVSPSDRQPEAYTSSQEVIDLLDNNLPSFLETEIMFNGIYGGSLTVRSYLGKDNDTDFNIERNCRYIWNLHIDEEGIVTSNTWKKDGSGLEDRRFAYFLDDENGLFYVERGESLLFRDMIESNMAFGSLEFEWESHDGLDLTEDGFTVDTDAERFTVSGLSVNTRVNYFGIPFDVTGVAIVNKTLSFNSGTLTLLPDRLTDLHPASVNYMYEYPEDEWQRLKGKRGSEWTITGSPDNEYFNDCGFNDSDDLIYLHPKGGLRPGSYSLGISKEIHPELSGGTSILQINVPEVRFGFGGENTFPTRKDLYYNEGDLNNGDLIYVPLLVGNVNRNGSVSLGSCWKTSNPREISITRVVLTATDLSTGEDFPLLVKDEEEIADYDIDEDNCSAVIIIRAEGHVPEGNYLVRLSLFPGRDYSYHKDIELTIHVGAPENISIGGGFDDDEEVEL